MQILCCKVWKYAILSKNNKDVVIDNLAKRLKVIVANRRIQMRVALTANQDVQRIHLKLEYYFANPREALVHTFEFPSRINLSGPSLYCIARASDKWSRYSKDYPVQQGWRGQTLGWIYFYWRVKGAWITFL